MKAKQLRRCVGCKESKPQYSLIRLAKDINGHFNIGQKLDGRGAYLCPAESCMAKAKKSKGLERSFKRTIPAEAYELLTNTLASKD